MKRRRSGPAHPEGDLKHITRNPLRDALLLYNTETREWPIAENGFAVNKALGNETPASAIVARISVVTQNKILAGRHNCFPERLVVLEFRFQIWLRNPNSIHVHNAVPDLYLIPGNTQDSLDERFVAVLGIPEDDDISSSDIFEPVNKAIDEYPLLVHQARLHAGSLNLDRLDNEDHNKNGYGKSKEDIAEPVFQFEHRPEFLSLLFGTNLGSALIVHRQTRFLLNLQLQNKLNLRYQRRI
jgi:hypothetical protein